MIQEQLNKILKQHKLWLYSFGFLGKRADLSFKGLRNADLTGANLRSADLRGANLRYTYLSGADLRYTYLSVADLRNTDLTGANLRGADLTGANLRGADLKFADLRDAKLRFADLKYSDLEGANLESTGVYFFNGSVDKGIYNSKDDKLYIGCQVYSLDYWLQNYVDIGKKHEYSDEEIEIYGNWFKSLKGGS